ncbi:hypothetical protein PRIPAC_97825 [Pristionchus pacificus]|uniref:Uncharacterized protein n=1 Tax=Pristionchus pacificus TaxID=54126 RepID=A0A2A6BBX5_PRIPA|nr:hypothetical protein PRIPAC_97825 [Pristionchus pacificus]|eukprot:PDM63392.1 hypothetical protein PRIPAC_53749 [Pristionchus pacificus]
MSTGQNAIGTETVATINTSEAVMDMDLDDFRKLLELACKPRYECVICGNNHSSARDNKDKPTKMNEDHSNED